MNALVLGCGRIARRRVLPALHAAGVERVRIASKSHPDADWRDYAEALREFDGGLVYVSLPNAMHAEWVRAALESGRHTVVDKPAFVELADTEALASLAARRGLTLAEATVWNWHPQVDTALTWAPDFVHATFTFPGLDASDFRHDASLGGGALLDQGPYAASCARVFLGGEPDTVTCRTHSWRHGVDASFSVMMTRGARVMTGHFGMHMEYRNTVSLIGADAAVDLERAFTSPPDQPVTVRVRRKDASHAIECGPADSFREFLAAALARPGGFAEAMLADAFTMRRMRDSARQGA